MREFLNFLVNIIATTTLFVQPVTLCVFGGLNHGLDAACLEVFPKRCRGGNGRECSLVESRTSIHKPRLLLCHGLRSQFRPGNATIIKQRKVTTEGFQHTRRLWWRWLWGERRWFIRLGKRTVSRRFCRVRLRRALRLGLSQLWKSKTKASRDLRGTVRSERSCLLSLQWLRCELIVLLRSNHNLYIKICPRYLSALLHRGHPHPSSLPTCHFEDPVDFKSIDAVKELDLTPSEGKRDRWFE